MSAKGTCIFKSIWSIRGKQQKKKWEMKMEILVILSSTFAKIVHCKVSHGTALHVAQQDMDEER
jgi:hypothetical protein